MRLAQAAALDTTLYSEESLEKIALQSKALSDALENPELTAEEINSLTAQLTAALSELTDKEEPAEVDREKLNAKIIEAKAIEQGDFTDESYGNLQNAITAAEGVYADENATQEQIRKTRKIPVTRKIRINQVPHQRHLRHRGITAVTNRNRLQNRPEADREIRIPAPTTMEAAQKVLPAAVV